MIDQGALQPASEAIATMKAVPTLRRLAIGGKPLTDADLKAKTAEFKQRLANGATLDDILPEAFATVREASIRSLGMRHFDVQMVGGVVLHRGKISEMRTGEGKTLTSTLPLYLNALAGHGAHLITVNDYLARRDCAWMGQIYDYLGLTVSCVNHQIAYRYDAAWKVPPKPELTEADLAAAAAKEQGGETDRKRDETGSFLVQADFLRRVG